MKKAGILTIAAAMLGGGLDVPLLDSGRSRIAPKIPLSKKQKRARAKSKAAKQARKKQRN